MYLGSVEILMSNLMQSFLFYSPPSPRILPTWVKALHELKNFLSNLPGGYQWNSKHTSKLKGEMYFLLLRYLFTCSSFQLDLRLYLDGAYNLQQTKVIVR